MWTQYLNSQILNRSKFVRCRVKITWVKSFWYVCLQGIHISYSDFRMTLKNGLVKCSLFVLSANGTKHGFFVFPPKKPLIWRRHCSIDQSVAVWRQSEVSIDARSSRAWSFFTRGRSLNQPKATRVCIRSINQSNRSISARLLFLFCSRVFTFQGHTKIALTSEFETGKDS